MKNIPIYLFTGFIEAGKTKFIQGTLEDVRFNDGERTLVLLCEEGVEEFDFSKFSSENVFVEAIENDTDLTHKLITTLAKKHKAERIIIEYNILFIPKKIADDRTINPSLINILVPILCFKYFESIWLIISVPPIVKPALKTIPAPKP